MYIPAHFAADDGLVSELLTRHGAADLVTSTAQGLLATLLPFVYDATAGEHGALLGHVARNNDQWRVPPIGEALVIVRGADTYISPAWYQSTAEHGRVVPTWNYLTAHVYGRLIVHDDPVWVEALVRRLTAKHEDGSEHPWSVDDAPPAFIAGQLRAIVGLELAITRIEAKAKASQNRPQADIDGVITNLRAAGLDRSAEDVERFRPAPPDRPRRRDVTKRDLPGIHLRLGLTRQGPERPLCPALFRRWRARRSPRHGPGRRPRGHRSRRRQHTASRRSR